MRPRLLLRSQALALLGLLVATGTGLPSHHHADPVGAPALADAGHHTHGARLLDEAERLTSQGAGAPTPAHAFAFDWALPPMAESVVGTDVARPTSRAPPSSRPRAPPLLA